MLTRRRIAVVTLAGALVAGCQTIDGVEFDAPATAPPGTAPALVMASRGATGLPSGEAMLSAVAAGPLGAVIVGTDYEDVRAPSFGLFSVDGATFELVELPRDVFVFDVAASDEGFVAIGSADAPGSGVAFLFSPDGRSWETLAPDAFGGAGATPWWVRGGPAGFRAGGTSNALLGGTVSWSSADGRRWVVDEEPVLDAAPVDGGWLEIGEGQVRLLAGADADGAEWRSLEEPPGGDAIQALWTGAAVGDGLLVLGSVSGPCGLIATTCAWSQRAWWSGRGTDWRLADVAAGTLDYVGSLETMADGTLVAFGEAEVLVSRDGWRWSPLEVPGRWRAWLTDVAPFGDGLLVIGTDAGFTGAVFADLLLPEGN